MFRKPKCVPSATGKNDDSRIINKQHPSEKIRETGSSTNHPTIYKPEIISLQSFPTSVGFGAQNDLINTYLSVACMPLRAYFGSWPLPNGSDRIRHLLHLLSEAFQQTQTLAGRGEHLRHPHSVSVTVAMCRFSYPVTVQLAG